MRTFAALLLLGILFSCNKGQSDFILTGTISDGTFSGGLTGAEVKLYEIEAGGASTNLLSSTTLSSDGKYSFTFPRNKAESYTLSIRKENYFDQDITIPFSDLSVEEENVRNYSTTAKSWARLIFTTTNPSASLKYIKQQGKTGCAECCGSGENYLNGAIDTMIYCPNDGNTTYSYHYWLLGTSISGEKSANTTAFDTVDIILNY
jgi:hypothetical protein